MALRRDVRLGDGAPRGYGIAWYRFPELFAVCYPWPTNWAVRWARLLWFAVRNPRRYASFERDLAVAYDGGVKAGKAIGLILGREEAVREIEEKLKAAMQEQPANIIAAGKSPSGISGVGA